MSIYHVLYFCNTPDYSSSGCSVSASQMCASVYLCMRQTQVKEHKGPLDLRSKCAWRYLSSHRSPLIKHSPGCCLKAPRYSDTRAEAKCEHSTLLLHVLKRCHISLMIAGGEQAAWKTHRRCVLHSVLWGKEQKGGVVASVKSVNFNV